MLSWIAPKDWVSYLATELGFPQRTSNRERTVNKKYSGKQRCVTFYVKDGDTIQKVFGDGFCMHK